MYSVFFCGGFTRGLHLFLARVLCITAADSEIECRRFSSLRSRFGPSLRRFLKDRMSVSVWPSTFVRGDVWGRRLLLLSPASPSDVYSLHHLRSVGLDMPHLLHVRPASWVFSYSFTHPCRCFSSWVIAWLYQASLKRSIRTSHLNTLRFVDVGVAKISMKNKRYTISMGFARYLDVLMAL